MNFLSTCRCNITVCNKVHASSSIFFFALEKSLVATIAWWVVYIFVLLGSVQSTCCLIAVSVTERKSSGGLQLIFPKLNNLHIKHLDAYIPVRTSVDICFWFWVELSLYYYSIIENQLQCLWSQSHNKCYVLGFFYCSDSMLHFLQIPAVWRYSIF